MAYIPLHSILGSQIGINLNTAAPADIATISIKAPKYIIRRIIFTNASTSLAVSVAAATVRDAATGGGNNLATIVFTALTASTKFVDQTLAAGLGTDAQTAQTLYVNLATAHGSAATCDIYIIGDRLS